MSLEPAVAPAIFAAVVVAMFWLREYLGGHSGRQKLAALEDARRAALLRANQAEDEANRWRAIVEALPVPIWHRDHDGAAVACNRACITAFGNGPSIRRAAATATGGADNSVPKPAEDPILADTRVVIEGERRSLRPIEIAFGAGGSRLGYALDRTEAESARRELQRHIEANAAVLEGLAAAVAIFGPEKRLRFFNTAFSRLWDLDAQWLVAAPTVGEILERLHAARRLPEYPDFPAFKHERCALFTSLIEPRRELMHLPDGRTLQVTISPHPFGGLTYVYDDVSDQLALERSYNTLAAVQRATLDHLFEAIAVYGEDGRLKLYNPAFCALWGLGESDVVGDPHISEIVDRARPLLDDGCAWPRLREELIAQVTCQMFTSAALYRRDGSVLQVASVPLPDGEVLLTYLDISDSARVERALRERNQALETAARLKTEFVANISHEMRTPLNAVIGFAEILEKEYFGPLNPSQREYGRAILDGAHQLVCLIDDISDLATIEAGDFELEREPVDVWSIVQGVVQLTRERARSRALEIEMRCPAGIGVIEADKRRLKQALFNLVSNAIKFTPPGGIIRVEAERYGNELLLSVRESAGGLAADRVIDRHHTASRNLAAGSFGLSLVKILVERHGGRVETEAVPGSGARVICRLPIGQRHEATALSEAAEHSESDSPRKAAA